MVDIAIYVAGVDVTADVVFSSCSFQSLVNSKAGEGKMRVRDSDAGYSFTTGSDWLVTVDGGAAWRGFVTSVTDTFIAPTGTEGPTRFFDLVGADMNLLFTRRVVYDQSTPTNVAGTQFPPGTPDTDAITELLDNWLLLGGDDIDTTSGVTHVGDLDPEQKVRAWSGGWQWGDAMNTIAMIPAAIYYLRPEVGSPKATLCYVDVDEPTAPFGLSDVPNGTTTKGYREMEITLDGSSMANDVMGWGMGYGSQTPVFKRERATGSIDDHGLWQSSIIATGVYKQGTINRMVDSIINGSPESKRGAKNDRPYVNLVTYEPGLLAGHVVPFTSNIWGFSGDIPVRQMTLLFEGPEVARYEVVLSHEIDAPWSFYNVMPLPNIPIPNCPPAMWPCGAPSPGGPQQPEACDCGVTDSWERVVAETQNTGASPITGAYAGNSDAGPAWSVELQQGASCEVDSDLGLRSFRVSSSTGFGGSSLHLPWGNRTPTDVVSYSIRFTPQGITSSIDGGGDYDVVDLHFGASGDSSFGPDTFIRINPSGAVLSQSRIQVTGGSPVLIPNNWWASLTDYFVTITYDPVTGTTAEVSDGMVTYAATSTNLLIGVNDPYITQIRQVNIISGAHADLHFLYGDLSVTDVDRCNCGPTDSFNRTIAPNTSSIGTSDAGIPWDVNDGGVGATLAVDPAEGLIFEVPAGQTFGIEADLTPFSVALGEQIVNAEFTVSFTDFEPHDTERLDINGFVFVRFRPGIATGDGDSIQFSQGLSSTSAPFDWVAGTIYGVRISYGLTSVGLTIMESGVAVVDLDLSGITYAGNLTHLSFKAENQSAPSLFRGTVDELRITSLCSDGSGCPDGSVIPGAPPTSPGGFGCETATRVSSTVYSTSARFIPGTVFVWRDGLLQRRVADYTEGSDLQSIELDDPADSGTEVQVCYFTEAPPA